jgi:hypothetical protein
LIISSGVLIAIISGAIQMKFEPERKSQNFEEEKVLEMLKNLSI